MSILKVTLSGVRITCPLIELNADVDVRKFVLEEFSDMLQKHNYELVGVKSVDVDSLGIMDTTNNHDPKLVEKVNICYALYNARFKEIVLLLADRDKDEFVTIEPENCDDETVMFEYCMHIADNQDLKTIINYCRM